MSVPAHGQVYLCLVLPLEARQKLAEFNLFTDGTSNVLAYTSPIREEGVTDNTRFSISIDYFDVYDENGEKRDWSKLTYTILHEYGHVLLEDETQIVPYRRILRIADDGLTAAHRIGGQHIGDAHGVISHRNETPLLVTGQRDIFAVNGVGPAGLSPLL